MDDAVRRARAGWPVRKTTLSDAAEAWVAPEATLGERLALVWSLTVDAWAMAGLPLPDYPRGAAPGRILRPRR